MHKRFEPSQMVGNQPGALSRKDAAKYLSCSTRYLDMLAKSGEIRRCKLGSKTVYTREELERFLRSKMEA